MIYIFTALYCEARALIRQLGLRKKPKNTRFQQFYNDESGISLTVTGVGEIAAAAAVGSVCAAESPAENDLLLNIGTCAYVQSVRGHKPRSSGDEAGIFVCNQIIEQATGRSFYPDMLYRHGFREATIVTGMRPWNAERSSAVDSVAGRDETGCDGIERDQAGYDGTKRDGAGYDVARLFDAKNYALYDMEAAAVYQAGAYFFGPHQMIFLKIVSDSGTADAVSKSQVERLMEECADPLSAFLGRLSEITENGGRGLAYPAEAGEAKLVEMLCRDLHCSKTMEASLRQHLHYLMLSGTDYGSVIENLYAEGMLPCRDKREGKLRLEELKRRLV